MHFKLIWCTLYCLQSISAAEAVSWHRLYLVVCHFLPSIVYPLSILLNSEHQARKQYAPCFKDFGMTRQGLDQRPPRFRADASNHNTTDPGILWLSWNQCVHSYWFWRNMYFGCLQQSCQCNSTKSFPPSEFPWQWCMCKIWGQSLSFLSQQHLPSYSHHCVINWRNRNVMKSPSPPAHTLTSSK